MVVIGTLGTLQMQLVAAHCNLVLYLQSLYTQNVTQVVTTIVRFEGVRPGGQGQLFWASLNCLVMFSAKQQSLNI